MKEQKARRAAVKKKRIPFPKRKGEKPPFFRNGRAGKAEEPSARTGKAEKSRKAKKPTFLRAARAGKAEDPTAREREELLPSFFRGGRLIARITAEGKEGKCEIAIARIAARGIPLLRFEKKRQSEVIEVCAEDRVEVIAILRALCYTVKKTEIKGRFAPCYFLFRRAGAVIGAAAFVLFSLAFRPLILRVEVEGSASYLESEILSGLQEKGIAPYRWVSRQTLSSAEGQTLKKHAVLRSVSVQKRGFFVTVRAEADFLPKEVLKTPVLYADREGTVLSVTVLRGKSRVQAGDRVSKGSALIEGVLSGKEGEEVPSFAAGEVVMQCRYEACVKSKTFNERYLDLLYYNARKETGAEEIVKNQSALSENGDGDYLYTVDFTYVYVVRGGY